MNAELNPDQSQNPDQNSTETTQCLSQVEAASLETVRDRAQIDTLTSYVEQRPIAKREEFSLLDVRKLQLQMDPVQQAAEGRQEVLSERYRRRK